MGDKPAVLKKVVLPEEGIRSLFGPYDENIKFLEGLLSVRINLRGNELMVEGDEQDAELVQSILEDYAALFEEGRRMSNDELKSAFKQIAEDRAYTLRDYFTKSRLNPTGKKQVTARSVNQRRYLEAIDRSDIVFGIGVAGTGKTYLGVAKAVEALMQKRVNRIILARPAVEAGEKLGFLPGDLQDKVDPYLRPLYDALFDLVDYEKVTRLLEKRVIEVAPLAFMRGRAQPLHSRVLTTTGWREMGSLEVGDEVIGSDGRPNRVLGVYPQGQKQVYRATMNDGATTLACAEHLWAVRTPEDKRDGKPPRVLETREMIGNLWRFHQHRYELPLLRGPVEWDGREVPVDPYALGMLLGDGCITDKTSPTFATTESELVTALADALDPLGVKVRQKTGIDYALTYPAAGRGGIIIRNPLTQALRGLDLAGTRSATKFIPEDYLYNDSSTRLAVLQGLLDTDGGPVMQEGRTCRIQYVTTSERLKDDVVFLVRSLGGVAYCRKRKAEGRKPGFAGGREVPYRNDAYVIDIRLPEGLDPFRLERKAKIYRQYGGGRPMRFIDTIEPAGIEETQCISVAAPDALYVTDDFILTHNTLSDAFIILDEAQNTTSEQMKMFLTRIGFGSKAVITGDVTQIDLPAGRRSGLVEAQRVLGSVEGIEFIYFTDKDVVRHHLVQMIILAYDQNTKTKFEDKL
jgi:phosphate starvation-inducible protein PhoH and related proteins